MKILILRNRQRAQKIDLHFLRKVVRTLLQDLLEQKEYEIGVHLVGAKEMASINETFLQHTGSTDVITFDYSDNVSGVLSPSFPQSGGDEALLLKTPHPGPLPTRPSRGEGEKTRDSIKVHPTSPRPPIGLNGELFISVDDALSQARHFHASWQSEIIRYVVHGLLHLRGHDDLNPASRRKMKREENRLLEELSRRLPLTELGKPPTKSKVRSHKNATRS